MSTQTKPGLKARAMETIRGFLEVGSDTKIETLLYAIADALPPDEVQPESPYIKHLQAMVQPEPREPREWWGVLLHPNYFHPTVCGLQKDESAARSMCAKTRNGILVKVQEVIKP